MGDDQTRVHSAAASERVYSAERSLSIFRLGAAIFSGLGPAHALGLQFAQRSIKSKYRQSLFGMVWAFLPPLATAMVWIVLNKVKIVNMADVGVPYPLFIITGMMLWSVLSNSIMQPLQTIQSNRGILVKVNFPREALLFNAFYEILFNACFSISVIVIALFVFQVDVGMQMLYFIPLLFLLMIFGVTVGLLLLPFSLLYRDVQFLLPVVMQFLMYLTPVIYAKPVYAGAAKVLSLNPITPLIVSARSAVLNIAGGIEWQGVLLVGGITLALFCIGLLVQRITLETVIERMGS